MSMGREKFLKVLEKMNFEVLSAVEVHIGNSFTRHEVKQFEPYVIDIENDLVVFEHSWESFAAVDPEKVVAVRTGYIDEGIRGQQALRIYLREEEPEKRYRVPCLDDRPWDGEFDCTKCDLVSHEREIPMCSVTDVWD